MGDDMATVLKQLGYQERSTCWAIRSAAAWRFVSRFSIPRWSAAWRWYRRDSPRTVFYPEMREQQKQVGAAIAEQMKETPMYKSYVAVAPKPDDFPRLLQAMGDLMREHYDYSADVKKLTMPTMLIFGDSDMYRPEHIVEFYKLLGGGLRDAGWNRETMSKNRLAIIPDQTHYDIFFSPKLVATALPFLDGVSGSKTWAETSQP